MTLASRLACDRVRSQVSLELDDELSHLERAMVESHLRRCAGCGAFRDEVTSFTHEIREAPLEAWSGRVPVRPRRRRVFADTLRVASVAASIAVALGLGVSVAQLGADSSRAGQSVRPAYLDSPGYDLSIIRHVQNVREARRIARAV
jgi:predicted anti-sigma-YlaC factor YlaD